MKGLIRMVRMRSCLFSSDRVAMIAGTLHPKPITSGMNDLPCSPIICIILSITNAALAMYPVSSMKLMPIKRIRMFGRNTITPPTPPIMPSMISDLRGPGGIRFSVDDESSATPCCSSRIGDSPNANVR